LAEHIVLALGYHRHAAQAQREQFFTSTRIVDDVDNDVVYLLFRKKLFRSEAGTSPRLEKEDEFFDGRVHGFSPIG
jgi:hypothetical protein